MHGSAPLDSRRASLVSHAVPAAACAGLAACAVVAASGGHTFRAAGALAALAATQVAAAVRGVRRERADARALADAGIYSAAFDALEGLDSLRAAELAEAERVSQRMWHLGQQVTGELDPARALQRFVDAAADVAQADGAALALVHGDLLRVAASAGIGAVLQDEIVPRNDSAVGRAVTTGASWRHPDVSTMPGSMHPAAAARLALAATPVHGMLVVPVARQRGVRYGALALLSRAPRHFTDAEVERVEALADMLSVALTNAELVGELRQAELRFRTLFRAAPDAVLTVLESGVVHEANDCVRDVTGLDPSEVVGRSIVELVAAEDRFRFTAALARAAGGAGTRLEVRVPWAGPSPDGDGRNGPAAGRADDAHAADRVVAFAMSGLPEATPATVLCIGRDITAEREMRGRLAETERLAAVGELVAGVAHEVNNPLSSVSAFAQLVLRDGGLTDSQRESVEVIRDEAGRAAEVVRDLLAFSRRSSPASEMLDLNGLVERTLRLHQYQLTSGSVYVDLALERELPRVAGDPRQLQQVVFNLVTNALQAMGPRGGTLRLATHAVGGQVHLEVTDTGRGVEPSARSRVFEPFFTTKAEGEGTGLGLSVSYGIVAAHGGSLRLARTSAAGTTFVMTLPAADTLDGTLGAYGGRAGAS